VDVGGLIYSATGGRDHNELGPANITVGTTHQFSVFIDPFAHQMHFEVDGLSHTWNVGNALSELDFITHFGLMPISANGTAATVWFDDLTYSKPGASGPSLSIWKSVSNDYFSGDNWTAGVPDAPDAIANFMNATVSPTTILINDEVTLGTLRFGNKIVQSGSIVTSHNLAGVGSLTMEVTSGAALVDVIRGEHKINVPLTIASDTVLHVDVERVINGSSIDLQPATLHISDPVVVNAGKSLTHEGNGQVLYESTISVLDGGSITFNGGSHPLSMTLANGARATLSAANPNSYALQVHSISLGTNARVDLGDNLLAINYSPTPDPISTIRASVAAAFAGGWDANGYTSSSAQAALSGPHPMGIGVVEASTLGITSLLGQSFDGTTVLARATYSGDSNIDGTVNSLDFNQLAVNFNQNGKFWFDGDFNYDGVVNALDFNALATNYGQALAGPPLELGALVPEPAGLAILAAGLAMSLGRRRQRLTPRTQQ
jgi:hypothetical protein